MNKCYVLCLTLLVTFCLVSSASAKCAANYTLAECGPLCPPACGMVTCLALKCEKDKRCYCTGGYSFSRKYNRCVKNQDCER
ncbi:hypothetical protein TKK_0007160 [Trichogramma kaykai]|uniref:TIL domain-containing protein n=1 Tax=Trichogramma kaykai TaxID=54128 RepID=A0ABD2X9H5_9HYME